MTATRKLAKNTLYNLSAYAILTLVSFITLPFLLRAYGQSVYGVFVFASSIVGVIALFDFGLTSVLTKEIAQIRGKNSDDQLKKLTTWSLVWLTFIGAGTALCLVFISNLPKLFSSLSAVEFGLLRDMLLLHAGAQLIIWPTRIGAIILAGKERYDVVAISNVMVAIANAFAIITVLSIGRGPLVLVGLTLSITIIAGLAITGYSFTAHRATPRTHALRPGFSQLTRRIFVFSLPVFGTQITAFFMQQQTNRMVLGFMLGATAIALYEIAAKIGGLALQASTLLVSAFPPFIARLETMATREEMERFFIVSSRYLSFALVPLFGVMIPAAPFFIRLWVGAEFLQATLAMQLLVAAVMYYPMFCVADSILIAKGRMKVWMPFAILTAIINVVLALAFVRPFGLTGVAFATFIAYSVEAVCFIAIVNREILISFAGWVKRVLLPSLGSGLVAATSFMLLVTLWTPDTLILLCFEIALSVLAAYVFALIFLMQPDERSRLVRLLPQRLYRSVRDFYVSFDNTISMVTRQSAIKRFVNRWILHRKADLYHFELHITDHCNLNCKSCGHYCNIAPEWHATQEGFKSDIRAMASLFGSIEQIIIMGGEPLLHPQIEQFFEIARETLPDTRIYLMTNAILLPRMEPKFWEEAAKHDIIIQCDDYPIKLEKEKIAELANRYGVTYEWTPFRKQFFRAPLDADCSNDPYQSLVSCQGYSNCPIVREGKLYHCAPIAYSDILRSHFDLDAFKTTDRDYFSLPDVPATWAQSWQALDFLLSPPPWCGHCDFDRFEYFDWDTSKRQLDEWVIS